MVIRLRDGADDAFRLGIHKASEAITNCLKFVRPKVRIDIRVEDTSLMRDRQMTSNVSFVFPKDAAGGGKRAVAEATK